MVKKKTVSKKRTNSKNFSSRSKVIWKEPDSVFFLKLVIFLIIGSQWIYIQGSSGEWQIPIPVGLILGLVLATHEHFQIDRKIEYVVLLFATFISFWLPLGLTIQL